MAGPAVTMTPNTTLQTTAVVQSLTLLGNATATGPALAWAGGKGNFTATCSNWNGATVTLQYSVDNGANYSAVGIWTTLGANGGGNFNLPACLLKAVISNATPGAGVNAVVTSTVS